MRFLISVLIVLFSTQIFADTAGIKNEDGSFKVSEKALNVMGIKFQRINRSGPWIFPKEALVKVKFTRGVYRRFEDNITYVIVNILKEDAQSVTLQSDDLEAGDDVAVSGANFLRLTEADLNSDTVDNCSH